MKTDNAVDVWPDAALKNFIFYIFSMYEFSHSLGHSRPTHSVPVPTDVRYGSDSDHSKHESELTLSANKRSPSNNSAASIWVGATGKFSRFSMMRRVT
jgi:hypothetical protein